MTTFLPIRSCLARNRRLRGRIMSRSTKCSVLASVEEGRCFGARLSLRSSSGPRQASLQIRFRLVVGQGERTFGLICGRSGLVRSNLLMFLGFTLPSCRAVVMRWSSNRIVDLSWGMTGVQSHLPVLFFIPNSKVLLFHHAEQCSWGEFRVLFFQIVKVSMLW